MWFTHGRCCIRQTKDRCDYTKFDAWVVVCGMCCIAKISLGV